MTYGPIDFVALEFKGNSFKGEIFPALMELVDSKIVRLVDLVIVRKDKEGKVTFQELQQADDATIKMFDPLKAKVTGLIHFDDLNLVAEKVEIDTTAAVLMFENLWAVRFVEAVLNANGRTVMFERIPAVVVNEAMEAKDAVEPLEIVE